MRRAPPVDQPIRPSADGIGHHLVLVVHLVHFPRHRAKKELLARWWWKRGRFPQFDAQRVAVQRPHAFDLAVIVERTECSSSNLGHAENFQVFKQRTF